MTQEIAHQFANDWLHAWNSHDINLIMEHYSEKIEFHSPLVSLLKFNDTGIITSKEELKKYFSIGLNNYPNLNFKLQNVFVGVDTLVIYYSSINNRLSAEVFQLNESNQAVKVYCNYS
ncbi:MAG: nuclear transport factor 2 family protein [Bacteroidia bacterium]|nr:nuclear transport factor 2 family protein [Bacteroidia bacterium]